jgi:KH domain
LVCDFAAGALKQQVTDQLDYISLFCGVDIFLLGPKLTPMLDGMTGDAEMRVDQRWRVAIYGDILASEHAKARVLIHIDQLVSLSVLSILSVRLLTWVQLGRVVDAVKLELSMHQQVCGRHRKNIKVIESSTGTAIYFPPPYSRIYRYCPPNASRRDPNDIFITGENAQSIEMAKQKLHEVARSIRLFMKDVTIAPAKIDSILLSRLDKVRKILEANGTYVLFPPLASKASLVRVQGSELDHVDRTVREIMALVSRPILYTGIYAC